MNNIFDIDNLMDDIPLTYEECNEVDDTNYAEQEAILDEWLKSEIEYDTEQEVLLDEWLKSEEGDEKNE